MNKPKLTKTAGILERHCSVCPEVRSSGASGLMEGENLKWIL